MARVRVQTEDFDVGAEFAALTAGRTDIGGIGCFVGTVRGNASGPALEALELEQEKPPVSPVLQSVNDVTAPKEIFLRSPLGWCTPVTDHPMVGAPTCHPAKYTPAGGALFKRMNDVSVDWLACSN